jgi:hypothetical protein
MRKRRYLSDLYHYPGCKPKKTIHGVFGDPHAYVITLVRRGKKLHVGYAVLFTELIDLARYGWFAISPLEAPEFISNWRFETSSVEGAAK